MTYQANSGRLCRHFYSHASCEAWLLKSQTAILIQIFLLTCLLRGMTDFLLEIIYFFLLFLLTCLLRGMTPCSGETSYYYCNFYSHASCEAWQECFAQSGVSMSISTHMPLARHDILPDCTRLPFQHFYSHASCEAWPVLWLYKRIMRHFYSHASCEAWHNFPCCCGNYSFDFYSHASCEAWLGVANTQISTRTFLLTCLLRGMTRALNRLHFDIPFLLTCLLRGMTSFCYAV